jgi:hypothetical protein
MQKRISKFSTSLLLVISLAISSFPYHHAEALFGFGGLGRASERVQLMNNAELAASTIQNTATAVNTASLLAKENILDGIGWAIAKQMVSSMTQSLINWINSGFQGSPAFITDLNGFLLDALDTAAGEYIKSLGGIGEFICSPFRLDVQAALSINYQQARSGMPSGATAPMCKLSDITQNIEGFLNGIGDNGWEDWLEVTSNPQNTPYGSYLEAEAKLNIRLKNEAGQEIEIANWGHGFLSKRVCEAVEGKPSGKGANCKITTPGQVISEALTFQLSTGPRSLIEADEINEIIGALINQLTLQAMQGINGLLGLGGNDAYTATNDVGQSYIDAAAAQQQALYTNISAVRDQLMTASSTERRFLTLVGNTIVKNTDMLARRGLRPDGTSIVGAATSSYPSTEPATAILVNLNTELLFHASRTATNIVVIRSLITRYDSVASSTSTSTNANTVRKNVMIDYVELINSGTLHSESGITTKRTEWGRLFP